MSDVAALDHLDEAIDHIQRARDEAEGEIATTELSNLYATAEDCKSGLQSDIANSTH